MNFIFRKSSRLVLTSILVFLLLGITSCNQNTTANEDTVASAEQKIGVLLVNHGSRSETWRKTLFELEDQVRDQILADGSVKGVKTAHMEYTEPSIASRMKEFDKEGYTDVIIIPIFLTVSPHPFEDIPTIIGQKSNPESVEELRMEKIERYTPKARTYITPLLDFTNILQKNILRRAMALSKDPANEGIVLIGYGDVTYDKEWGELFAEIAKYTTTEIGISEITPIICEHSERKSIKPDRYKKILQSAMKQSLTAYMPVLHEAINFKDFITSVSNEGDLKCIAHCEETKKNSLKSVLFPKKSVLILIGPEGDFSSKEIAIALSRKFVPVTLGERRLRTETAAIVACHSVAFMNE